MAIPVTCSCGRSCRIKDAFAGRRIRCPQCGKVLQVPDLAPGPGAEGDALAALLTEPTEEARAVPEETREERIQPALSHRKVETGSLYAVDPRAKASLPKSTGRRRVAFEKGWFGSANAGVVGGLLMIAIAVIWFVAGLAVGYIIFYPPVLLVVGIIALVKGLSRGS
jgi:hypothetical protein